MDKDTEEPIEEPLTIEEVLAEWPAFLRGQCCATCAQNPFKEWAKSRLDNPDDFDEVYWCDRCEDPIHSDDRHSVNNGESVCNGCFSSGPYFECFHCVGYFDETTTIYGDREVCDRCRGNYYSYCDECQAWYHDDDGCDGDHGDEGCGCESPLQHFSIRNDGEPALSNDERATVALPAGCISVEGLDRIQRLLLDKYYSLIHSDATRDEGYKYYDLSRGLSELGDKWQEKRGNYTKRLSALAYKKFGLKLDPEIISTVGCIARDNSTAVDFQIEITRDLNMSAADFFHEDSCWWQSYSAGRCSLKSNGGFGMRTFEREYWGDKVTGRAWVMPLKQVDGQLVPTFETMAPDAFIVFNGYGNLSGYVPARILSHMAGMTYRKITFTLPPMYVNGDSGYLVAGEEIAQRYTDGALHLNADVHSTLYSDERVHADAA